MSSGSADKIVETGQPTRASLVALPLMKIPRCWPKISPMGSAGEAAEPPAPFLAEDLSRRFGGEAAVLARHDGGTEAPKAGYEVVLVERSDRLGGYLKEVFKLPPSHPPYDELQDFDLDSLTQELDARPEITTYLGAQIRAISGAPCMFDVQISQNGREALERVGAIVLASGSVPYNPEQLAHLGYGKAADVVTMPQLEAMFAAAGWCGPSTGQPVTSVAFILCAVFSRSRPSALLFRRMLCGIAQTSPLFQGI